MTFSHNSDFSLAIANLDINLQLSYKISIAIFKLANLRNEVANLIKVRIARYKLAILFFRIATLHHIHIYLVAILTL